ncbi:hypothetical protein, partial [Listeria monocytogenes]|uniref:hypothetical protein n=1 Tax=Listeria monocytogenes TaxID=1639 RepID=UPI002FDBCF1F
MNWVGTENPPLPLSPSSGFRVLCFQTDLLWRAVAVLFTYWFCCAVTGDGWRRAMRQATAAVCLVCAAFCCAIGVGVACGW